MGGDLSAEDIQFINTFEGLTETEKTKLTEIFVKNKEEFGREYENLTNSEKVELFKLNIEMDKYDKPSRPPGGGAGAEYAPTDSGLEDDDPDADD